MSTTTTPDTIFLFHLSYEEVIMAIGVVFEGAGVSQDQYYQVFNEGITNRERPPGLLSHHAGPTENGFCVIETWESPEALQRFFRRQARRGAPESQHPGPAQVIRDHQFALTKEK
jgi:hypothetical protein